ncbi:NAD(P)H-binding protein [Deinococcus sp. QL22]|uniref:NAD(P)H-binding protein n=1 Tax=Deinococcus sp. QL22 TaxID=2939437 RepID=UPI002016AD40|nr:NAD(P)H-binding protein [Deinococcus sp. QL22]UQN07980.1 NAD(P)H-binding protein [Deinococcus sp. QL22]
MLLKRTNEEEQGMLMMTSASGQLGRLVASRLQSLNTPFIAATHDQARAGEFTRYLDFDLPETLQFGGIRTLLLISAGYGEDDVVTARHERVITAAERDGVEHIVYTSLTGAGDHLTFSLAHRWTERRLQDSRLSWTILRNGLYAELLGSLTLAEGGVVRTPLGEGRLAAVARADLADVTANVLLRPSNHAGKVYELVGPQAVGGEDVAEIQGAQYRPSSLAEMRAKLDQSGLLPFQPAMLMSIYSSISGDFLSGTTSDLPQLLGCEPRPALSHLT